MNKILSIMMITFFVAACSNTTKVTNEGTTKTGMIEESELESKFIRNNH